MPQYNSSNAPRSINNIPIPMDLSQGCFPPNRGWGQWRGSIRGNAAQVKETPRVNKRSKQCYNCRKFGHFATECRGPKQPCTRQAHVKDYMSQDEEMMGIQDPIHPMNLLDNTLKTFNMLPLEQKDTLITQYKGKREDFVGA
jgi:hypothetical protein